jgi:hypothetical protein
MEYLDHRIDDLSKHLVNQMYEILTTYQSNDREHKKVLLDIKHRISILEKDNKNGKFGIFGNE